MRPRLKVWWIPQVPMKPFNIYVDSFYAAKLLLVTLADYDLFQFYNHIKPDYCNVGGLCIWDDLLDGDDKWTDWETDDCYGIDTLNLAQCRELDARWTPPVTETLAPAGSCGTCTDSRFYKVTG